MKTMRRVIEERRYEAGDIVCLKTDKFNRLPTGNHWAIVVEGNTEANPSMTVVFFDLPFHNGAEWGQTFCTCVVFPRDVVGTAHTFHVHLANVGQLDCYRPESPDRFYVKEPSAEEVPTEEKEDEDAGEANVRAIEKLEIDGFLLSYYNKEKGEWVGSEFDMFTKDTLDEFDESIEPLQEMAYREFHDNECQIGMLASLGEEVWCGHYDDWDFRLGVKFNPKEDTRAWTGVDNVGRRWRVIRVCTNGMLGPRARKFFHDHPDMHIVPVSEAEYLKK